MEESWKDKVNRLSSKLSEKAKEIGEPVINPGDETKEADVPRNYLIDKLGLPKGWKLTVAEEKENNKNMAMNIALGAMGSTKAIPKPAGIAQNIIAKEASVLSSGLPKAASGVLGQTSKGSSLVGQPVFKTTAEKLADAGKVAVKETVPESLSNIAQEKLGKVAVKEAAQESFGKVSTPDMVNLGKYTPEQRAIVERMMEKYQHLKNTDPAQYQNLKQTRIDFVKNKFKK